MTCFVQAQNGTVKSFAKVKNPNESIENVATSELRISTLEFAKIWWIKNYQQDNTLVPSAREKLDIEPGLVQFVYPSNRKFLLSVQKYFK
jgi:hypothetical protein